MGGVFFFFFATLAAFSHFWSAVGFSCSCNPSLTVRLASLLGKTSDSCCFLLKASAGSSPLAVWWWPGCGEEQGLNTCGISPCYPWWALGASVEGPCPVQSSIIPHEGWACHAREEMLLCTSFGCFSADSSKYLVLGGGTGRVGMKVCTADFKGGPV